MLRPLEGLIGRGGLDRRDIAYLPQLAEIDRSFPIIVRRLRCDGAVAGGAVPGHRPRRADANRSGAGGGRAPGFERRVIGSLSGGQLQRILFARLLLQDARLILLDEPFTAIDTKTARDLLDRDPVAWRGPTVLAVLHDLDVVRERFPEALLLAREPVAWARPRHSGRSQSATGSADVRGVPRGRRGLPAVRRMTFYELALAPFVEFGFMRRALVGCTALALGSAPVGVFLMLRRMSLTGDAMAHAILPGAAVGSSWPGCRCRR